MGDYSLLARIGVMDSVTPRGRHGVNPASPAGTPTHSSERGFVRTLLVIRGGDPGSTKEESPCNPSRQPHRRGRQA